MKRLIFLLVFLFYSLVVRAQSYYTASYGSTATTEEARRIIPTPDSNYLIVGYSTPRLDSLNREGLVMKITPTGGLIWAKLYGGVKWEEFYDVVYTGGHYYCVGYTRTWVNDDPTSAPVDVRADIFLIKIKTDGALVWAKNLGSPTTSSSATIGNDVGLRLIAAPLGGVIVVARVNSGASSDQNNGLIWVDSDAKSRWAYQYDLAGNTGALELTQGIWKDRDNNFITGGWYSISSFPATSNGGMLFKVNPKGKLLWDRNTTCSPGTFESQYFGYYDLWEDRMFSTDFYSVTNGIREPQVMINQSATGQATAGSPQAVKFNDPNVANDNFRGNIFPIGDGKDEFVLAVNDLTPPASGVTQYATLISSTTGLSYQWSKKVGFYNAWNQISDLTTCVDNNQDLIGIGTVLRYLSGGMVDRDILLVRTSNSATATDCNLEYTVTPANLTLNDATLNLSQLDLNTSECGSDCWADNDTIGNVFVQNQIFTGQACSPEEYQGITGMQKLPFDTLNHVLPIECYTLDCPVNLSFQFLKPPKEMYFEITDLTREFVYVRFFNNMDQLIAGYNFLQMNLPHQQTYLWSIEVVYFGEQGLERRIGSFTIN